MQEKAEALTREITTLSETIVVIDKEMEVDNITFLQVRGSVKMLKIPLLWNCFSHSRLILKVTFVLVLFYRTTRPYLTGKSKKYISKYLYYFPFH